MTSNGIEISFDKPLQNPADDKLGYYPFAEAIASVVLKHARGDSLVIGLNGKWGTGKSTILNFIQDILKEKVVVVRFNPWYFSGRENLAGLLLSQLSAEVEPRRRGEFRNAMADLIDVASGISVAGISFNAKNLTDRVRVPTSLDGAKRRVDKILNAKETPILVMIDDIDRLSSGEIRDMFNAVKAVASLPFVSYLMAFDSEVVATALSNDANGQGVEYLEKIVQVQFPVPAIGHYELRTMLSTRLDLIIEETGNSKPDQHEWANVYINGIDPLITSPRIVNRIVNAFGTTYPVVSEEVCFIDFFCIECIRAVEPILYERIKKNGSCLTDATVTDAEKQIRRNELESWLDAVRLERREAIRYLLFYLFPAIRNYYENTFATMRYEHRYRDQPFIGEAEFFSIYFRFAIDPDSISSVEVKQLIASASDRSIFAERMIALTRIIRRDGTTKARIFLERMLMHSDDESMTDNIENIVMTLFDIGDNLNVDQDSNRGVLDFGNDTRIAQIAQKLLKRVEKAKRSILLTTAIQSGHSVSVATEMVKMIAWQFGEMTSHPPDREEDRLVDEPTFNTLKQLIVSKIEHTTKNDALLTMQDFPHLIWVWETWSADKEVVRAWVQAVIGQVDGLIKFVCGFVGTSRSWGMGDAVAHEQRRINFESLGRYIDIKAAKDRLQELSHGDERNPREAEAISLFLSQYGKDTE